MLSSDGFIYRNGEAFFIGVGYDKGDIIGCGIDFDEHHYIFMKNGYIMTNFDLNSVCFTPALAAKENRTHESILTATAGSSPFQTVNFDLHHSADIHLVHGTVTIFDEAEGGRGGGEAHSDLSCHLRPTFCLFSFKDPPSTSLKLNFSGPFTFGLSLFESLFKLRRAT